MANRVYKRKRKIPKTTLLKIDLWISICQKEKFRSIINLLILHLTILRFNYLWVLIILGFPIVSSLYCLKYECRNIFIVQRLSNYFALTKIKAVFNAVLLTLNFLSLSMCNIFQKRRFNQLENVGLLYFLFAIEYQFIQKQEEQYSAENDNFGFSSMQTINL